MHPLRQNIERVVNLTDEEFALVEAAFIKKKLRKGQYILLEGNQCDSDYFVFSGSLMQYYHDWKGKMHVVQFAFADWWISDWDSILRKSPSVYNITALEPSVIIEVKYEKLQALFGQVPKLETYFRVSFQKSFAAQQRRIGWLQRTDQERYEEFIGAYANFEQTLSQSNIASFLGMTRESLSRLKNRKLRLEKK